MNTQIKCEESNNSLNSSTVSFLNNRHINNKIEYIENKSEYGASKHTITPQDKRNLTFKGESVVDMGYFQYFKQTYRPQTHPHNHFFKVISSQKNKNFVELRINQSNSLQINNENICQQLQSVCPTKVEKARQLYDFLVKEEPSNMNSSDSEFQQVNDSPAFNERIQNQAFEYASAILNQRSNKLFKFNIAYKSEDNQINYLKHGMSNSALRSLKMSADYYQYVHMRFGIAPFVDSFYCKNFFEVNQRLLEQSMYENNDEFQIKYVINLSSVGAIYSLTECEILNLNNGFYLEIQYYADESVLKNQIPEINKRLRIQTKEYTYSQASSTFINKYYPNVKTWQTRSIQEVDCDIVDSLIKKRELALKQNNQQNQCSQSVQEGSIKSSSSLAQSLSLF